MVDDEVIAGHVVHDNLMFTNPIDRYHPDKKTSTYDAEIGSSIKVTASIQLGDQRDPSERNKGLIFLGLYMYIFQKPLKY